MQLCNSLCVVRTDSFTSVYTANILQTSWWTLRTALAAIGLLDFDCTSVGGCMSHLEETKLIINFTLLSFFIYFFLISNGLKWQLTEMYSADKVCECVCVCVREITTDKNLPTESSSGYFTLPEGSVVPLHQNKSSPVSERSNSTHLQIL